MPRESKLLTDEQKRIAQNNNIPLVTVYKRLKRGWDINKAITKQTRKAGNIKRENGLFIDAGRGKRRYFSICAEWDDILDKAIAESGIDETEWIEQTIIEKLKSLEKVACSIGK